MSPGRRPNAGSDRPRRQVRVEGAPVSTPRRQVRVAGARCEGTAGPRSSRTEGGAARRHRRGAAAPGAVAVPLRRFLDPRCARRGARTRLRGRSDSHQARQGRQEAAEETVGRARRNGRGRHALRRSRRQVPRQVSGRRRHDGDHHDAQSDAEVFHAHLGCGADHAGSVGGEGPVDAVPCRRRRHAAAVATADRPPVDRRPRTIARGDSRPDRRAPRAASASSITSCRIPIWWRCCASAAPRASPCRCSASSRSAASSRTAR